jgi:hypothetical protein
MRQMRHLYHMILGGGDLKGMLHAFVFVIVAAVALAIVAVVVLWDRDNILYHRQWDHHPNLVAHPPP